MTDGFGLLTCRSPVPTAGESPCNEFSHSYKSLKKQSVFALSCLRRGPGLRELYGRANPRAPSLPRCRAADPEPHSAVPRALRSHAQLAPLRPAPSLPEPRVTPAPLRAWPWESPGRGCSRTGRFEVNETTVTCDKSHRQVQGFAAGLWTRVVNRGPMLHGVSASVPAALSLPSGALPLAGLRPLQTLSDHPAASLSLCCPTRTAVAIGGRLLPFAWHNGSKVILPEAEGSFRHLDSHRLPDKRARTSDTAKQGGSCPGAGTAEQVLAGAGCTSCVLQRLQAAAVRCKAGGSFPLWGSYR